MVVAHELGHFVVAKLSGAAVERVSVGFGPRVVGTVVGGTEYRLSALPLGGYVKLAGQVPGEHVPEGVRGRPFFELPMWRRVAVIAAGPAANALLAVLLFTGMAVTHGVGTLVTTVGAVEPGSPADEAGLRPGDHIVAIDARPVEGWSRVGEVLETRGTSPVRVEWVRGGERMHAVVTPEMAKVRSPRGGVEERPILGVTPSGEVSYERVGALDACAVGLRQTAEAFAMTYAFVAELVTGGASPREVAGPIGIAQLSGQASRAGIAIFVSFVALLSVNLAVLNLLPIPLLDGGRLLFLLVEAVRRRPVSMELQIAAQLLALAALVMLTFYVVWSDITRLVSGG